MRNRLLAISALSILGAFANADVVLNQLDFSAATQYNTAASQDFEPLNDPFDIIAVDDFTVNASQTAIFNVEAIMNGFNGFANINYTNGTLVGFRVEFYTSLASAGAGMTGNAGSAFVAAGAATINILPWAFPNDHAAHIILPVSVTLPGPGTYWMGVAARMDATTGGQIGVNATTVALGNQNGRQANPGGGFGFPGNVSGGIPDPSGNPGQVDLEYKIEARAVPEPASMIALGLGVTALMARRRRKAA